MFSCNSLLNVEFQNFVYINFIITELCKYKHQMDNDFILTGIEQLVTCSLLLITVNSTLRRQYLITEERKLCFVKDVVLYSIKKEKNLLQYRSNVSWKLSTLNEGFSRPCHLQGIMRTRQQVGQTWGFSLFDTK